MNNRDTQGFTLVELVVAMAVAAILLGVAVPSFVSVVSDSRLRAAIEPVRFALMHARSEAVKTSRLVTVCPRASATTCGNDWKRGVLVFVDSNASDTESIAVRDATDPIVRDAPAGSADVTVVATGSADRQAASATTRNWIRFNGIGRANWGNGTIVACDERGANHARALNLVPTGDIRSATASAGEDVVRDVFGNPVTCP